VGEERGDERADGDGDRGAARGDGGARETRLTRTPDHPPSSWLARRGEELGYQDLERDERVFVQQAAELRQAIKESRLQIEESLGELQRDTEEIRARALDAFDLKRWAREHPWRLVGVAAAIGFYIGFRE
jgi:ElaB/YqjD/DUF883 family membrane-anchored ribosome-binding protein